MATIEYELERAIFNGLRGTGKKSCYIRSIMDGRSDPYTAIEEIPETFLRKR